MIPGGVGGEVEWREGGGKEIAEGCGREVLRVVVCGLIKGEDLSEFGGGGDAGEACYNPGPGSTKFSHPPAIPKPSPATIPLPANVQPTVPVIPSSFTTAIPEIPITWPISHTHQHVPTKYPEDPMSVPSDNSNEDSPMRTQSPSPIARPSNLPETVTLEVHKQPSLLWQAWLSLPGSPHSERRSISPNSEESAPKRLHHDDGSYTPRSPLNPIVSLSLDSLNYDCITI